MKQTRNIGIAGLWVAAFLLAGSVTVSAQKIDSARRQAHGKMMRGHDGKGHEFKEGHHASISGLTEDQQKKIKTLHTSFAKESLPLKNQLAEKQAHLRTLQTAEKADLKAVNATIDDMGRLKSELQKKKAANREEIRKLLTDEQRVAFDSRGTRHGKGGHHGGRHGARDGKRN